MSMQESNTTETPAEVFLTQPILDTSSQQTRLQSLYDEPELAESEANDLKVERPSADNTDDMDECSIDDITMHGFIPLHRKFQEAWWWEHTPWSYAQLFLWMQMTANRKARQADFMGKIINIPYGALATSCTKLSERSGLSRETVATFIRKMSDAGELEVLESGTRGMVIRICKFKQYMETRRTRPTPHTTSTSRNHDRKSAGNGSRAPQPSGRESV